MVHDQPHVGFVDAHSKGHRSHYNVNLFVQKGVLMPNAGICVESGMVGESRQPIELEHLSKLLYFLTAQAVNNGRATGIVPQQLDHIALHIRRLGLYLIGQVGAVKAGHEG